MSGRTLFFNGSSAPAPKPVPECSQGMSGVLSLPLPSARVIHVWSLVLSTARIDELLPLLAEDEHVRAREFIFQKDHDRYVAVRGWLRRLCGAYLQEDPAALRFRYGAAGKPALAANIGDIDLRFNVSHTHDLALLAFSLGREVGVDVEYIDGQVDVVDLARTCFSDEEQHVFHSYTGDPQLALFFQYWTSKEAYIKALGEGLSIPLQEFTVDIRPDIVVRPVTTTNSDAPRLTVHQLSVPTGYAGAIASEGDDWEVVTAL